MAFVRRIVAGLAKIGVVAAICMVLLEGLLRLYPAAIPLSMLVDFDADVRESVAKQLALPTQSEQVPVARDDGGPPLSIYSPNQIIRSRYRDPGIVNEVQMDSAGFCNPRSPAAPASYDIVALGDSFTWCTNVHPEDAWPSRLAGAMNATVYNLGRPRTGLHEYIQLFKAFGLAKKPRLVVLNVYAGNDLRDAIIFVDYAKRGNRSVSRDLATRSLSTVGRAVEWVRTGWLGRKSYAFNLLFVATIQGYEWLRRDVIPRDPKALRAGMPNFHYALRFGAQSIPFNPDNADVDEVVHARAVVAGSVKTDAFDAALDAIKALSEQHKFDLLITYTPSAYTAYADVAAFADESLGPVMAKFSDILRGYFAAATARRGIDYLDLTPALQQAARAEGARTLLYYQTNVHLTAAGHRVIAEAIAAHLKARKR